MTVRNPRDIATSGLASSAFARHYLRNLGWCLFLALLRCFSSGGSPPIPILFSIGYLAVGFPIRKSPDRSLFAAPRSLSQLITSFIGSWCQGIPLALFIAWPMKVFRLPQSTILEKSLSVLYYSWIMQAHIDWSLFRQNCILPNFLKNKFPFMLPSHNCIIIIDIQFSRCIFWISFSRNSVKHLFRGTSINLLVEISGIEPLTSCLQGRRSPSWAKPPYLREVVGQNGLEPSTSRLSVVCSSQLSYWPISASTIFRYIIFCTL